MKLDELRKVAEAATPGPWKVIASMHGRNYKCVQYGADEIYTSLEMRAQDATFCATFSPNRVLRLLAVIEAAKAVEAITAEDGVFDKPLRDALQNLDAAIAALEEA